MAKKARGLLIDTSALIAHLRGRIGLHRHLDGYEEFFISAITLYELEFGAIRAGRESDFARLRGLLESSVLPLGRSEAERAAQVNGRLAQQNRQIGPRDALIAGAALVHGLDLLTLNAKEFRRVPGLQVIEPEIS
jgi:predicted nucleic acid-binding protein